MFLAIEDNVLLYVKGTAGQDNTKSVDSNDLQLEKLEKINKVLEDIKNLTEQVKDKDKDVKVEVKSENKESELVSFGNSLIDSLTKFRESLTNKNINSNVSMSGGMANSNSMIKTMQDSVVNNNKNVNDLIKTNRLAYQMQTNFGNKMKDMGHKFMDVITTPIKLYTDIKQNISSAMDFLKNPMEGMSDWLGLGKKDKKELEVAGIVKTTLDINKVKKSSAVGVALVWFNEEIKKTLGIKTAKSGLKDKAEAVIKDKFSLGDVAEVGIGGMMSSFITKSILPIITTALPYILPAILAGLLAFGFYKIVKNFFNKQEDTKINPNITNIYGSPSHSGATATDSSKPDNVHINKSVGLGLSNKVVLGPNDRFVEEQNSNKDLIDITKNLIQKNEGKAGPATVNINKGKGNVALGSMGWTRDRGLDYLTKIYNADKEKFTKIMGQDVVNSLSDTKKWFDGNMAWDEKKKKNFETLIASDKEKYTKIDNDKARADTIDYIESGKKLGITDPRAIALYADARNLRGPKGSREIFEGKTDFDSMYKLYTKNITGHKERLKNLEGLKNLKINTDGITTAVYNNVFDVATASLQESFDKTDFVNYKMGGKGWKNGLLDCSGFVGAVSVATMKDINTALNKKSFTDEVMKGMGTHAAGQFQNLVKHGGGETRYKKGSLQAGNLKEGDVIGIDSGQKNWDGGRQRGIDHIAMVARNKKGELVVRESTSGKGVIETSIAEWSKKAQKYNDIYVTSMYKVGKLHEENEVLLAKQTKTSTDLAKIDVEKKQLDIKQQQKKDSYLENLMSDLSAKFPNLADKDKESSKSKEIDNINNIITSSNDSVLGIPKAIMQYQFAVKIGGDNDVFV